MPTSGLHVRYRRSGGIAGVDLVAHTLAEELSAEQAGIAADLLADGPSAGEPENPAEAPPAQPDQFSYELHLSDGENDRTYRWEDRQVPEHVRPLLAELGRRARPAPPA
jgi:hypothetical protein